MKHPGMTPLGRRLLAEYLWENRREEVRLRRQSKALEVNLTIFPEGTHEVVSLQRIVDDYGIFPAGCSALPSFVVLRLTDKGKDVIISKYADGVVWTS